MLPFFRSLRPQLSPLRPPSISLIRHLIPFSTTSTTLKKPPAVAVFWDLDNKPPNSIPSYDAAVRLRLAASAFGPLRFIAAFANSHAFCQLPAFVRPRRSDRRALDRLEDSGALVPSAHHICRVCGRNFRQHSKLMHHFRQIHEREQAKRLNRINSARGARGVHLAAKLSMKIEKFKKVANEILLPPKEGGYGLADELKRAGVIVKKVDDRSESADRAIRGHMADEMDRGRIGCLVLVSDDSGLAGVLKEARMRCLMTVVIGDEGDGALKRYADAAFSWKDVASGKARTHAGSAVGKWKDKDLLRSLEWRYEQSEDGEERGLDESDGDIDDGYDDDDDDDGNESDVSLNFAKKKGDEPWWKLDLDDEGISLQAMRLRMDM